MLDKEADGGEVPSSGFQTPDTEEGGAAGTEARAAGGPPPGWDLAMPPAPSPPALRDSQGVVNCHNPLHPCDPMLPVLVADCMALSTGRWPLLGHSVEHSAGQQATMQRASRAANVTDGHWNKAVQDHDPGRRPQRTWPLPTSMRPEPPPHPRTRTTQAPQPLGTLPGSKQTLPSSLRLAAQRCQGLSHPPLPAAQVLPSWLCGSHFGLSENHHSGRRGGRAPFRRRQQESEHVSTA